MDFLRLGMLLGSGAIAAPIIIHLLNRQKYKRVEWAAMRFLREAIRKTHKRLKLEQILLLALRCLAILLLAVALARPYVAGSILGMKSEGNHYVVIALDDSYSMGYKIGHQTLFERGREVATGILETLRPGDKVSILMMSGRARLLQQDPSSLFEDMKALLASQKVSDYVGAVRPAAEIIRNLLAKRPLPVTRVYMITDNQKRLWYDRGGQVDPQLRELLFRADSPITVVDVGPEAPYNVAITAFETSTPVIARRYEFEFAAEVQNQGQTPAASVAVTLYVDGIKQKTTTLDNLQPHESKLVTFRYSFETAGPHSAHAQLDPDPLPADNIRTLALDVHDSVNVLIVDGKPGERLTRSETLFLRFGLNPQYVEQKTDDTPVHLTVARTEDLPGIVWPEFQVVYLANVPSVPESIAQRIEEYVSHGGGLVLFVGDQIDPRTWNRQLAALLPVELGSVKGDPTHQRFEKLIAESRDHPVLNTIKSNGSDLSKLFTYQWIEATAKPGALVLAKIAGSPAIVERAVGKGVCVAVTTSAGSAWNDYGLSPDFVLLIQELTRYAAAGAFESFTGLVGGKLSKRLPASFLRQDLYVRLPTREDQPQAVTQTETGELWAHLATSDYAGLYVLEKAPGNVAEPVGLFAVNVDPTGGDLARISADELKKLLPGVPIEVKPIAASGGISGERLSGREIWKWFAAALFLLLALETYLAWRFGAYKR